MATIIDIAKELGVSPSTVSRALREESVVNNETIRRVKDMAHKLNYVPNKAASMLRRSQSRQIGVLIPDISNTVYGLLVKGIDDTLRPQGYHMCLCCTYRDPDEEASLLEMFLENRCAGIIVASREGASSKQTLKQLKSFEAEGGPIVFSGYEPAGKVAADVVGVDVFAGARMMTEYLITQGHASIALLGGADSSPLVVARREGYRRALQDSGIAAKSECIIDGGYDHSTGVRGAAAVAELVSKGEATAVFCVNDMVAIGLVSGLLERGVRIPDDVSVAGFDDIPEAQWISVPLTTVRQKQYEIGCLCASRILNRISSKTSPVGEITIKPELVIRASSGPVPGIRTERSGLSPRERFDQSQ